METPTQTPPSETSTTSSQVTPADETQTTWGLQPNIAGVLCYSLWFITGIFFFITEKDKFVRFHALQSILLSALGFIVSYGLSTLSGIFPVFYSYSYHYSSSFNSFNYSINIFSIINFVCFAVWLLMMFKAYKGEKFKFPWVGEIAEKNA